MGRREFMETLTILLGSLSPEERDEALQYYEDYFEEAGADNEEEVIRKLGSPQKVAAMIQAGQEECERENGEFTEYGYADERFEEKDTPARREESTSDTGYTDGTWKNREEYRYGQKDEAHAWQGNTEPEKKKPWTSMALKIALIVLIGVTVFPIIGGLALGILATVAGVILASVLFFAGLVLAAAAVAVAGLVIIIIAMINLPINVPVSVFTIGVGLLLLVLGVIFTVVSTKLCLVIYPAMFRFAIFVCRKIFYKNKKTC